MMDPSDHNETSCASEDSEDRVSVIQWAQKKVISSDREHSDTETVTIDDTNDEASVDDGQISNVSESDTEEVEIVGEFPQTSKTYDKASLLPSFYQFTPWGQFCQNNPYVQCSPCIQSTQLSFGLSSTTQNWLQTQYKYTKQYQYGNSYPLNLLAVALRAHMLKSSKPSLKSRPRKLLPKPVPKPNEDFQGLMEVSETEFVETKVYHLDRSEGVLRYKCRTCDTFIRKKTISKRRPKYGNNIPTNKCRICSKSFFTFKQLQSHLFRHSEKKLSCSYCSKKFLTKSEINNHINTHTGQKPHQCPACPQSFAQSSRYYAHIRDLHKKYHCNDCFRRNYTDNTDENKDKDQ